MRPWYATREQVKAAPELRYTARDDAKVDRAIEASSTTVDETELRQRFYPVVATYTFPAPRRRTLMLDDTLRGAGLVELDTLTVNGVAVDPADRDLLPVDGPPYLRIEFADTITFGTGRRPISAPGTWGHDNLTGPAGELAGNLADAVTSTADVTDSALVGVGSLLTIEAEKLLVAGKSMLDTGQTLQANLTASTASSAVAVADGTAYAAGEVIQLDSERMLVESIAGNTLTVKRPWDGTVLAAHTAGAAVFAPRRLTVERGVLGTTAAAHGSGVAVSRQLYPGPVVGLAIALAVVQLLQETGGYAQDTGEGDDPRASAGRGLREARRRAQGLARLLIA